MDLLDHLAALDGPRVMADLGEIQWSDRHADLRPLRLHRYRCDGCGYTCSDTDARDAHIALPTCPRRPVW